MQARRFEYRDRVRKAAAETSKFRIINAADAMEFVSIRW